MLGQRLTTWISDGVTVEITEADVVADLDAWFVTDRWFPEDSAR
jgi:hypothetical protein